MSKYLPLEVIGSGTYGVCFKVQRQTDNAIFVSKVINFRGWSREDRQSIIDEENIMRKLDHPFIVRMFDYEFDKRAHTLSIIMEFCKGGDLEVELKKTTNGIKESRVWRILIQLSLALQYLHSACFLKNKLAVMHRDVKPANVFVDAEGNAKLGDFGLVRTFTPTNSFSKTFTGTPYYMSPEVMNRREYGEKHDVWSLGCMLYELLTKNMPFRGIDFDGLVKCVNKGKYTPLSNVRFSADIVQLIGDLLVHDVEDRPTISEVLKLPYVDERRLQIRPS